MYCKLRELKGVKIVSIMLLNVPLNYYAFLQIISVNNGEDGHPFTIILQTYRALEKFKCFVNIFNLVHPQFSTC